VRLPLRRNVHAITGVAPQPEHKHMAANLARFAFCKEDSTIEGAANTLHAMRVEAAAAAAAAAEKQ
jgi:hypothetical protein